MSQPRYRGTGPARGDCDQHRQDAFYAHFRDKEDLLVYGLEELRGSFETSRAEENFEHAGASSPTLAVFEHFAEYRDVWTAMAGRRGADMFQRYLHEFLSGLIHDQL